LARAKARPTTAARPTAIGNHAIGRRGSRATTAAATRLIGTIITPAPTARSITSGPMTRAPASGRWALATISVVAIGTAIASARPTTRAPSTTPVHAASRARSARRAPTAPGPKAARNPTATAPA
jgi:hypothetical protein